MTRFAEFSFSERRGGRAREDAAMLWDDRELARRFPSGDEAVVRAVYARYGRAVHTVAYSILHDATAAADVVQLTFLNVWRASARFDPDRELGPWLYAIARRQAIDALRRDGRSTPVEPETLDTAEPPPSLEQTWEAWQVRLAVDQLADDEREVVRLAWFAGLSHPEIADKLGIPVGTVKSRSHRAHRRLANLLAHLLDANRSGSSAVETEDGAEGARGERR
jgi:RNA polymerase sigma-70 factor (ECF subfamily)